MNRRVGCQAFTAKINLIHMRPVGILSMLYFAQNALFLRYSIKQVSNKNNTEGADDLDAMPAFPVRAHKVSAPGRRIVRARRSL